MVVAGKSLGERVYGVKRKRCSRLGGAACQAIFFSEEQNRSGR